LRLRALGEKLAYATTSKTRPESLVHEILVPKLYRENTRCIIILDHTCYFKGLRKRVNATFNNFSVTSWGSVLLAGKTGVTSHNQRPAANHWQTLSHNVVLDHQYVGSFLSITYLPGSEGTFFSNSSAYTWDQIVSPMPIFSLTPMGICLYTNLSKDKRITEAKACSLWWYSVN